MRGASFRWGENSARYLGKRKNIPVRNRGDGQHDREEPATKSRLLEDERFVRPAALGRATIQALLAQSRGEA
jgi:hypothetical protein